MEKTEIKMKLQKLLSLTRKAIDEYAMIEEGDKIAVGISGGKDSLAMLYGLHGLQRFYPKHFDIEAITVHSGIKEMDFNPIKALCKEMDVHYTVVETDIYDIVFHIRREENPCSLCSKLRKGAFNDKARELGCNKIAYAHHKDDIIETLLMSLIYEGRLHSFSPVTYLDRTELTLIRPLMFVNEADIIGFEHKYELPVVKNLCPADGATKREYIKNLIKQLNEENPGVRERIFTAVVEGHLQGWPIRNKRQSGSDRR